MCEVKDLTGKRFGRWTVLFYGWRLPRWKHAWICRCDCGQLGYARSHHLAYGLSQSCGCLCRQRTADANQKHGWAGTRTHRIWKLMRERCRRKANPHYHNYGGRGIKVCKRWESFANFINDMGECPNGLSIGRINNNLGYGPKNCRWETRIQQANNKRNNIVLKFGGVSKTLPEWSRSVGISKCNLRHRIVVLGWSAKRALTTPVRKNKRRVISV